MRKILGLQKKLNNETTSNHIKYEVQSISTTDVLNGINTTELPSL